MRVGHIDGLIDNLWEVAYDSGELAEAVTSLTISNLLGNTDQEYELIIRGRSGANNTLLGLRFNGDTGNNYGTQGLVGYDSTFAAFRDTGIAYIELSSAVLTSGNLYFGRFHIFAKSGYLRTVIGKVSEDIATTTITRIGTYGGVWSNTADEITSLTIHSTQANGLGIGTRIILLKKVSVSIGTKTGVLNVKGKVKNTWQEVYNNILTSAATSITISSLTGNTDVLYRLRIFCVGGAASSSLLKLLLNNDTGANYGMQEIYEVAGTGEASRATGMAYGYIASSGNPQNNLAILEIYIFAKSGYNRLMFCQGSVGISGAAVGVTYFNSCVWNNSADEITSIVLTGSGADGYGIGSHITLEKLVLV